MWNFPTTQAEPVGLGHRSQPGIRSALNRPAPRLRELWKKGQLPCLLLTASLKLSHNLLSHPRRVRLFKKGDKLSKEAKERKLKREYIALVKLDQLLFFTDMGREGANFFQQQMRDRKMAENMASVDPDMSVEKAQKFLRRSLEHQRKSDNAKRSRFARNTNNS